MKFECSLSSISKVHTDLTGRPHQTTKVVLDRLCITDEQLLRFERCGKHDHLALTVYQMREP